MNSLKTSDWGRKFIQRFEGLYLKAYYDSAGVITIGYGHTDAAGPPAVHSGMVITEAEADSILAQDLGAVEADVNRLVSVPLNQNQFDALVSFQFNTGKLGKSTLLKKLNAGDFSSVPAQLDLWVNAGGRKLNGLVTRRREEGKLFNKPEFPPAEPAIPSSVLDVEELSKAIAAAVVAILEKRTMVDIEAEPAKGTTVAGGLVKSKTAWGAVVTALPLLITQLAPLIGVSIPEDTATQLTSVLVTVVGLIFTLYGRTVATQPIV